VAGDGYSPRLLVVDDDAAVATATAELLRRSGFMVDVASSGRDAVASCARRPPDLMLLDYEMPEMDALDVLEALREDQMPPPFPVLILTGARLSAGDQVLGLEAGARDYLPKGIGRQVLVARIRAALRDRARPSVLHRGELRIDIDAGRAVLAGRTLDLDRTPLRVLQHLAARDGQVVTKRELLSEIWGTDYAGLDHAVEQAVYAVRSALGERGWIETVHRRGYRFVTLR
jgi:two-component system, OmpR family, KDP operon response regulator KdpE